MTVQLDNVTIRYGQRVAVDGITVRFPPGAVGLLGRNGAGKSSVLKALLGLVRPASGTMRILDLPADAPPDEIRARVGYMPERDGHVPGLSGFEMVTLLGRLSGLGERDAWRRAHEVLYLVGLEEQRYRPVSGYSTGMRQKAKLAAALVHDPQVLFLDEPTNGLDPSGRTEMLELVRQLSRELGKSVVLSTHILQDVEAVCDSVVVLDKGRMVAEGSLTELTRSDDREFLLQVEPASLVLAANVDGLELAAAEPGQWRVQTRGSAGSREVFALVQAAGGVVRQLTQHRRSLEEVFLGAVAGGQAVRR
jgi:ABC-2 type transport system ATP-binding protein